MDDEFNQAEYQAGYAEASSLIDTYGAMQMRGKCGYRWLIRSSDYQLGFKTAVGVAIERQLSG